MNEIKDDQCDYIEPADEYNVNTCQLIIDGETLEPVVEADRNSIIVMMDGLFVLGEGNTLRRLPFNIRCERVRMGVLIQDLPDA